ILNAPVLSLAEYPLKPRFHLHFLSQPSGAERAEPVNSLHSLAPPNISKTSGGSNTSSTKTSAKPHNTCWCTTLTHTGSLETKELETYTKGHLTAGRKIPFK
ncbi:hypothetical protein TNCV_4860041, partial [Trichonephila clavipes]